MIQTQLILAVLSDPDVVDLIGSRIYPMRIPQNVNLPAAVYQRISKTSVNSLDGDSGLDYDRIQITSWANSYAAAAQLAAAIRTAINSSSLKSVTEMEIDLEDPNTHAYRIVTDYAMWSSFNPDLLSTLSRFVHVTYEGTGSNTEIDLPSVIEDDGFYLVTLNGRIATEGLSGDYTVDPARNKIVFNNALNGGTFKDQGLIIYQEKRTATYLDSTYDLFVPTFESVEFDGDTVTTEVDLPSIIEENGFYLVTLNGRIAQEGASNEYTINAARTKVIFNSALQSGVYKDQGLVIYQEQTDSSYIDGLFSLNPSSFNSVMFDGDSVTTEVELPSTIPPDGFYFVSLNGRTAKEGSDAEYTINSDRNKIIFNSALAGGTYKDEGIIIYQQT